MFLSHDWGKDENNRDNHARVAKVNELLKARGFKTWFDNDRMVGDIVGQMCQGVEKSAVFVAFVTARYISKVLLWESLMAVVILSLLCTLVGALTWSLMFVCMV